jgi:glutathione S-transferase
MRTKEETARTCLEALPAQLDRVDALLAEGVIGGERPNAADLQIATSVALLLTMDDLRPFIEDRPARALARRLVPDYPGHVPPSFPGPWLEPLHGG